MIYLEPSTLTWRPLLTSYIKGSEFYEPLKEFAEDFENFFVWLANACIYHIRHESKVSIFEFILKNNYKYSKIINFKIFIFF